MAGFVHEGHFAHKWFIGCDDDVNKNDVIQLIDKTLCKINDDYAVERTSALKHIFIEILHPNVFIDFLHATGKFGAMNKFPRVIKNAQLKEWETFIEPKLVNEVAGT